LLARLAEAPTKKMRGVSGGAHGEIGEVGGPRMEARGQHVQQEAAHELRGDHGHDFVAGGIGIPPRR
jgi:hypothetical protein